MKSSIITIVAFLFLMASCGGKTENQQQSQPSETNSDSVAISRDDSQVVIQKKDYPREGIRWGNFRYGTVEDGTQDIMLFFTASDGTVDSLMIMDHDYDDQLPQDCKVVEEDINFDGTPDLQVFLGYKTDYCKAYYEGFVWDQENGGFVLVPNYHYIPNPLVYWKGHCIIGVDNGILAASGEDGDWPHGAMFCSCDKYEWIDGKLVLTKSWEETIDMDKMDSDDFDFESWFDAWLENELKE